jgi:hypothetical protein
VIGATDGGPLERGLRVVAARAGWSVGQAYTATIGLVVVVALLVAVLPGLLGADADTAAASTPTSATTPATSPGTTVSPAPLGTTPSVEAAPDRRDVVDTRAPRPADPDADRPPATRCDAAAVLEAADQLLGVVSAATGGLLPSEALVAFLAAAAGCDSGDPLLVLAATLVQVGGHVPDSGLPEIDLPVIPLITIPPPLGALLEPLAPAIRPLCAAVGQGAVLGVLVAGAFPIPISTADLAALTGQLLVACGAAEGL